MSSARQPSDQSHTLGEASDPMGEASSGLGSYRPPLDAMIERDVP